IKVVVLTAMVSFVSCTDLTEQPFDEVTQENFNPTTKDIPSLMAPAYTPLRELYGRDYLDQQFNTDDIFVTPSRPDGWYGGGQFVRLHKHEVGGYPPFRGWKRFWRSGFCNGVNAINRVIFQVESETLT
ncbi:MAG: hypothetical protein U5K69_30300, partial [Balneolaceae bacterium]|nr:hypothetical protein [Balneolaceae bacterium]